MRERIANPPADKADRDLMDVLVSVGFDANTITGMFISMMFAGHHTTSGTAAWTLIELLRHRDYMQQVIDELDEIHGDTPAGERPEYTFAHTRQMPKLEAALKESLRLHPPLIVLMRVVQNDIHIEDVEIPAGQTVAMSPAISNRLPEDFPDPDAFDPDRYQKPRQEDLANRWAWIPFGAGRHRCVGAQFAMMQLKAIFSVLLQNYDFTMLQSVEVLPQRPLEDGGAAAATVPRQLPPTGAVTVAHIEVDLDLCQGHGVCEMEAAGQFRAHRHHVELLRTEVAADDVDDVERAVAYCPTRALRLVED